MPVHNEGANLAAWWASAKPFLPDGARVRVVYDFDGDDTLPVVRALAGEGAPIEPLRNASKGALGALVTGLRSSQAGPVLVSMADLSDDFSALPAMLDAYAGGAKVVVASRYMPGGAQLGGPVLKRALSRLGGLSLRALANFPVHDATNSFRLYDAELVSTMELTSTGGFEVGFEITLRAWMAGERIAEVPCVWRDRVAGESRFDLARWLPRYAELWWRAMKFGLSRPAPKR